MPEQGLSGLTVQRYNKYFKYANILKEKCIFLLHIGKKGKSTKDNNK